MHIYMCVYIYTYIYTHTYIHICIKKLPTAFGGDQEGSKYLNAHYVYMYVCMYVCMYVYIYIYIIPVCMYRKATRIFFLLYMNKNIQQNLPYIYIIIKLSHVFVYVRFEGTGMHGGKLQNNISMS